MGIHEELYPIQLIAVTPAQLITLIIYLFFRLANLIRCHFLLVMKFVPLKETNPFISFHNQITRL